MNIVLDIVVHHAQLLYTFLLAVERLNHFRDVTSRDVDAFHLSLKVDDGVDGRLIVELVLMNCSVQLVTLLLQLSYV